MLGALAAGNILFVAFLWATHARFPFTLDLMEFTVLQHVMRALQHQPIYDAAQSGFVALAYNPLYYVAVLPMTWLLGPGLFALRLFSILGALGSTLILYLVVARRTGSSSWGLLTAGLFAAAYRAMDAYLETAHSDSWLIFTALLGTWLLGAGPIAPRELGGPAPADRRILVQAAWRLLRARRGPVPDLA